MMALRVEVRSVLPGRVRWRVSAIQRAPGVAAALEHQLRARQGVVAAQANPRTGGVLLHFAPEVPLATARGWLDEALSRAREAPIYLPAPRVESRPKKRSPSTQLARLLNQPEQRRLARRAFAASVFNRLFEATPPIMIGVAVDVVTRGPRSWLRWLGFKTVGSQLFAVGGLSAVLWTLDSAVKYARAVAGARLANRVRSDLRSELYAHLQRLDLAQIESRPVSDWMMVLDDDLEQVHGFVKEGADPLIGVAVSGAFVFGTFLVLSPALAGIQFLLVPALLAASSRLLVPIRKRYAEARVESGELMAILYGNVSSMATIASFATQQVEAERVAAAAESHRASVQKAAHVVGLYVPTLQMIVGGGFLATLVLGGRQVALGTLTPGDLDILGLGDLRLLAALGRMGIFLEDYQRTQVALKRIFDVLDLRPAITSGDRALPREKVKGEIVFSGVDFAYEADRQVFHRLRLRFPAGKTVGIVGATGAGKSTILKLIQRFYDVKGGAVKIDGIDVRKLRLDDLRHAIATVPQEISLFAGTIRDNIAYGKPEATDEEVVHAARIAEAHEFIASLPAGYETRVGFGGKSLSVGQRQRIAIARVVLADRPILLFDEATSALDHETEAAVQRSLREITAGRTTLLVAHRLSTIRNADHIYVLDGGEVREEGHHDELLAKDGIYASLWRVQTGEAVARPRRRRSRPT